MILCTSQVFDSKSRTSLCSLAYACIYSRSSINAGFSLLFLPPPPLPLIPPVLNIGSASQIAVIQAATINQSGTIPVPLPSSIMLVPYFTGDSLLVAASLTGANALSALVNMLGSWMEEIGINRDSVPTESQLYEKLISLAREKMDTTLKVGVNFWGERLAPTLTGVVANVNVGNLSLGDIASATMKGIVENLHAMMPEEIFQSLEVIILSLLSCICIHLTGIPKFWHEYSSYAHRICPQFEISEITLTPSIELIHFLKWRTESPLPKLTKNKAYLSAETRIWQPLSCLNGGLR